MTIRVLVATARLQGRYPHDHFGTTVVEVDRGTVREREPQPRPGPRETHLGGQPS